MTENELRKYYINHNIVDTAKHFNLSVDKVTKLCKQYNIKKTQEQINAQILASKLLKYGSKEELNKHNNAKRVQTLTINYGSVESAYKQRITTCKDISHIDKEEFYRLYILENNTREYLMKFYNISSYMMDKLIVEFNCHKDKKVSSKIGLSTKYKQYGSKEAYFQHATQVATESIISKYGSIENYKKVISKNCKKSWQEKSPEELDEIKNTTKQTCLDKYGVEYSCQLPQARFSGKDSKPNLAFAKLLEDNRISYSREYPIKNRSYDFKIDNTLIEINPTPTHNSTYGVREEPKSSTYHQQKTLLAKENNFHCIHIWDWDNSTKVINLLKKRDKVFARKCSTREITVSEAKEYLNKYHLQGYARDSIRIALFYNNEIVSLMTFGKPRYNKKCEYELIRYCSHSLVIGGAEKLFNYFINTYNPESIISYCDNAKFNGDIYSLLRFSQVSFGTPSKHWYNERTGQHITDNLLRQRGFDQLFRTNYGKGTSNAELMKQAGFVEIYDSGQSTYIWNK